MMRVRLNTVGMRPDLLAMWLERQGWMIREVIQETTQRGYIIGEHENPMDFLGDGVNDGTRIMSIGIVEEPDQE